MKKVILTISALMISAMISTGAFATVPDLIPVQGVLADSADLPIDALTDITFTLYDGESSATVLWTDTFVDVDVVEGFFTVYLGDNTALDFGSLISNSEIWVGITVESDPEMDRFQLATVPFAIEAQVSQQVGTLTETDINNNFLSSTSPAAGVTATQVSNWDTAYGWGNHGTAGYLTAEIDPDYNSDPASGITATNITNWNTAFGWGNHSGLYAPISHTHAWGTITGIPAGFADGIDNDTNTNAATICSNGYFLNGDGTCDAVVVDTNTNAATLCVAGQFLNGDGTCDPVVVDTNTTYTAGTGLDLVGTSFSVDPTDFMAPPTDTYLSSATAITGTTFTTVTSRTITVPVAGTLLAIGSADGIFDSLSASNPTAYAYMILTNSSTGTSGNIDWANKTYDAGETWNSPRHFTTHDTFSVAAGATTVYLRMRAGSSDDTIDPNYIKISLIFIPN